MSYRTAREALDVYLDALLEAQEWCRGLPHRKEDAELSAALALVEQELKTRLLRFQAALETADEKSLSTYLQYDSKDEIQQALEELVAKRPTNPGELFNAIAEFYRALSDALVEAARVVESTPAAELFTDLQEELQTAIANQAWKMRTEA